jgi:hypothetical protein
MTRLYFGCPLRLVFLCPRDHPLVDRMGKRNGTQIENAYGLYGRTGGDGIGRRGLARFSDGGTNGRCQRVSIRYFRVCLVFYLRRHQTEHAVATEASSGETLGERTHALAPDANILLLAISKCRCRVSTGNLVEIAQCARLGGCQGLLLAVHDDCFSDCVSPRHSNAPSAVLLPER